MTATTYIHGSGNTRTEVQVDDVSNGLPVQGSVTGLALLSNITQIAGTAVKAASALLGAFAVNIVNSAGTVMDAFSVQKAVTSADWKYVAGSGGIADTSDVVLKAAAGASLYNVLSTMQMINTDTTIGTEVVIKDGATVIWRGFAPASIALVTQPSMVGFVFDPPLVSSANTALNAACITTSSQTYINAQGTVVG